METVPAKRGPLAPILNFMHEYFDNNALYNGCLKSTGNKVCIATQIQSTLGQGAEYNKFTVKSSKCKVHRDKMYLSLYAANCNDCMMPTLRTTAVIIDGKINCGI